MKPLEMKQCFYLLALALVLRLIHLSTSASNPITYFPGPDEVFYLAFAADVASGGLGLSAELVFMDPLYGYFLGAIFYFTGENLFALYSVQILIDGLTVWFIYLTGRYCWGHRAGLLAGGVYALASTAIFYTTTALKPTLAAFFVSAWVLATIRMSSERSIIRCLIYGCLLGCGVALRSNFLLLGVAGLCLSVAWVEPELRQKPGIAYRGLGIALGFLAIIGLLAGRNHHITGEWAFLPPNGGVLLHQLYNPANAKALEFHPDFVSYGSPGSILAGHQREAERILQRDISVYEMNSFWADQAKEYVLENPGLVISNITRKATEFLANSEIANNRSFNLERQFSVVLSTLPSSFGFLLALGIPGLIIIGSRDKRNLVVCLTPLAIVFATFVIFIAASRFRMHGLPMLAVGTGVSLAALSEGTFTPARKRMLLAGVASLGLLSAFATMYSRTEEDKSLSLAWGLVKMGSPEKAQQLISENRQTEVMSPEELELLGYIALKQDDNESAVDYFSQVVSHSPERHISQYNLSIAYAGAGQLLAALQAVDNALAAAYLPEYLYQRAQVLERTGARTDAIATYRELVNMPAAGLSGLNYKLESVDALARLHADDAVEEITHEQDPALPPWSDP